MTLRRDKKKESLTRKMLEHERYLLNLIKPIPHSFIREEISRDCVVSIHDLIPSNLFTFEEKTLNLFFYRAIVSKRVVFPDIATTIFSFFSTP